MKITITIPDEIAVPADALVKSLKMPPEVQPDGSEVIRPAFPGGLREWAAEAIRQNLENLTHQSPASFPGVKRVRDEQARKQREWEKKLRDELMPKVD
jgi:hypothetical protein